MFKIVRSNEPKLFRVKECRDESGNRVFMPQHQISFFGLKFWSSRYRFSMDRSVVHKNKVFMNHCHARQQCMTWSQDYRSGLNPKPVNVNSTQIV